MNLSRYRMSEIFHVPVRRALLLLTSLLVFGFILGCEKKPLTAEDVLTEAKTVRATGRLDEAIALLENFDREHPGNFSVVEALAFAYSEAGDPATSGMFFVRAAEIDHSQAEYLLMAADSWQTAGDPSTAISIYQQYLTLRPADQNARLTLAELYRSQGQADAARDALLQINRNQPNGTVQVRIGQLFLEGKNLAQAQQWFNSAAQFGDEARPQALLGLIEVAVRAERMSDAERLITVLDQEFPHALDTSPIASIRNQFSKWRATQDAVQTAAAQIAAATNPPNQTAVTTAANTVKPTATITRTTPSQPQPTAPADTDQPAPPDKEEMIAAVERRYEAELAAARTVPEPPPATEPPSGETRALFPDPNPNETLPLPPSRSYAECLALARKDATAGRYKEACKNFQRALARSSDDPQVWIELSEAQYLVGEVQIAPSSATEAVSRDPKNPAFRLQYLRVLQGSASPVKMLEEIEAARSDFPLNPSFALVLARAHRDLGNARFARRYFEEFIRLAPPNHPDLAAAEKELQAL